MKKTLATVVFAVLFGAVPLLAQERPTPSPRARATPVARGAPPTAKSTGEYSSDIVVVRDAQEQALDQGQTLEERVADPRIKAAVDAAVKAMERALAMLEEAKKAPEKLPEALAAEQAAYQALLKLSAREYQVMRSRNRGGGGGGGNQRNQRQLDQLELKQSEDRYETQRQASPQLSGEQREQLQVQNRLKELAQRQQHLNERLKELQTALQEAKTEQEREEIRRRLKRLREEEQQMLADVDELRQRMEQPQNQSSMAEARQQLERTRGEVQRAADALENESATQALASGTRAQRELEQLRDDFRKKNSSQFAEEMRQMRAEARELAQKQEQVGKKLESLSDNKRKTLSDADEQKALAGQLDDQKKRMTNLLDHATAVTEQAENVEPLLSKQLYDTLRKASQDDVKNLTDTRDELLNSRRLTQGAYDTFRQGKENSKKSVEVAAELLRNGYVPEASDLEQKARKSIDDLKRGIEHAAESVLGDDTEALRLAKRELEDLIRQNENEIAQAAQTNATQLASNQAGTGESGDNRKRDAQGAPSQRGQPGDRSAQTPQRGGQPGQGAQSGNEQDSQTPPAQDQQQGGQAQARSQSGAQRGQGSQRAEASQPGQGRGQNQPGQRAEAGQQGQQPGQGRGQGQSGERADQPQGQPQAQAGQRGEGRQGGQAGGGGERGNRGGPRRNFFDGAPQGGGESGPHGPITGEDYAQWSDRLRDVEEMLDLPELRNEVADVRERARAMRVEFKRHSKDPQWPLVKAQIIAPLAEVRDRISEELIRRESKDSLVPIDRDPVPHKFSDLVRRYYERLGSSE